MTIPILQGPLRGKRWIVGSQRHAFWLGTYEPDMQRLIADKVKFGTVFYDVGANVGFYSLLASTLVGPGLVVAFEPLPRNVDYLRRHLALNSAENVKVLQLAICERTGFALFRGERTGAMGKLEASGDIRVSTDTIDSLVHQGVIAPPNYLKMDIEGAEFKALLGASMCFERYQPVLFLATHGRQVHRDCCELLRSWHFDSTTISQHSEDRAEILALPRRAAEQKIQ